MAPDASAYAALGLEPNADWAAVESAYKTLIKQHHPDRAGGDPARASEINRAYRELRGEFRSRGELVARQRAGAWARRQLWLVAALMIAVAIVALDRGTGPIVLRRGPRGIRAGRCRTAHRARRTLLGRKTDGRPAASGRGRPGDRRCGPHRPNPRRICAGEPQPRLPPAIARRSDHCPVRQLRGVRRCGGRGPGPRSAA